MVLKLWELIWTEVLKDCSYSLYQEKNIYSVCLCDSPDLSEVQGIYPSLSPFVLAGLSVMVKYEEDLAKILVGRQELTNAEKLLDLPLTVYPVVNTIQKDMKGLRQIYDVYKAQKVRCVGF